MVHFTYGFRPRWSGEIPDNLRHPGSLRKVDLVPVLLGNGIPSSPTLRWRWKDSG